MTVTKTKRDKNRLRELLRKRLIMSETENKTMRGTKSEKETDRKFTRFERKSVNEKEKHKLGVRLRKTLRIILRERLRERLKLKLDMNETKREALRVI